MANDIVTVTDKNEESLRTIGWVSYLLHLAVAIGAVVPGAYVSVLILLAALLIDFVKRDDAQGTWQASHFSWRIRSVLWAGVLYVVSSPLWVIGLFLFNPAWIVISLWFLYRIVKGMVRLNAGRPMDA